MKSVRRVLFAQHDVILNPPLTRLDILSCRNLLSSFNPPLQQRLLSLFQYGDFPTAPHKVSQIVSRRHSHGSAA
jgi:hypothetical protein